MERRVTGQTTKHWSGNCVGKREEKVNAHEAINVAAVALKRRRHPEFSQGRNLYLSRDIPIVHPMI